MAQTTMMGVVLWSDAAHNKAVIWCEDHGRLAYYTPGATSLHDGALTDAAAGLESGDLVRFDLMEQDQLRLARNPKVLCGMAYQGLAQALVRAPSSDAARHPGDPANCDGVISLPQRRGSGVSARGIA
ncbi:hypothetical protein [Pseudaestuariivita sp.]|uniref:hypothetical protein n=1 Tax=Pseudaestuariivita sp. TaxID=2211669 RepID=UPI00405841D4